MRKALRTIPFVFGTVLLACTSVDAAGPDIAQVLALKPRHTAGVEYDTPASDTWQRCKLEVLKTPSSGWVLRDHRGMVVREFLDTNGDGVVDRWSYFKSGQEVYRDVDGNFNGKADQHRWFHAGGSRWGIDDNEDGTIDRWKVISAEEAAQEAVSALSRGDFERLRIVLLGESDVKALGLGAETSARIGGAYSTAAQRFRSLANTLSPRIQFNRFEGNNPMAVPEGQVGATTPPIIYQNATIITQVDDKTVWLRVPEVVKVGDTWKLSDVPELINPDKPLESAGVLIEMSDHLAITSGDVADQASMIEPGEELQQYAKALGELDQTLPPDAGDAARLVSYHVKRAELCARIGSKSSKLVNREYWYKQTADSLNSAVQTGQYPQGVTMLSQYAAQFAKTTWGKDLAAYYQFRQINAEYAGMLATPDVDHAKAQDEFLEKVKAWIEQYPSVEDAPEALFQLGNGMEFAGNDDEAAKYYRRLVAQFPKSAVQAKAAGALRRLESVGQAFRLVGSNLGRAGAVDTTQYRGKVIVVNYWATWCEPCKAEMPRLKKLHDKYGPAHLEIVGVSVDSDRAAAEAYIRQQGYHWPQIFEEGSMDSEPALQYGIISLPHMMLIDAQGRVVNRNLQFTQLEAEVERILAEKVAANPK